MPAATVGSCAQPQRHVRHFLVARALCSTHPPRAMAFAGTRSPREPPPDVGKVIGPVKTQFGYHLIKVHERTD